MDVGYCLQGIIWKNKYLTTESKLLSYGTTSHDVYVNATRTKAGGHTLWDNNKMETHHLYINIWTSLVNVMCAAESRST